MAPANLVVFLFCLLGTKYAYGQTSLYIPGFDPQPISANQVGVADGRTTWELLPGQTTGTFDEVDFFGTATLVEGASDAMLSYTADGLSLVENCNISNGIAVCSVVVGTTATEISTESAIPFAVQGGGTVSITATTNTEATTGSSSAASPTSSGSTPAQTSQTNSGLKTVRSSVFSAMIGVTGMLVMSY